MVDAADKWILLPDENRCKSQSITSENSSHLYNTFRRCRRCVWGFILLLAKFIGRMSTVDFIIVAKAKCSHTAVTYSMFGLLYSFGLLYNFTLAFRSLWVIKEQKKIMFKNCPIWFLFRHYMYMDFIFIYYRTTLFYNNCRDLLHRVMAAYLTDFLFIIFFF